MAVDLITKSVADQIARVTGEVASTLVKSATRALVKEGCDSDVLGRLAGAASRLIPRAQYDDDLVNAAPLEGSFTSPFLSNVLSSQTPTTQQILAKTAPGRALILLTSALACASAPRHVLSLLREVHALSHGLKHVAPLAESYLRACAHAPTISLIQEEIDDQLDWYTTAFHEASGGEEGEGEGHRKATNREIAVLLFAFGQAQQSRHARLANTGQGAIVEQTYIRVRNLRGMESVCAALTVMFSAKIQIGSFTAHSLPLETFNPLGHTTIIFEYDDSKQSSVGIALRGKPIVDYRVLPGSPLPPSPESMSAGQILSLARARLSSLSTWVVRAAAGAHVVNRIAEDMVRCIERATVEVGNVSWDLLAYMADVIQTEGAEETVFTMLDVIARKWAECFDRSIDIGSDETARPTLISLLQISAAAKADKNMYLKMLEAVHGIEFSREVAICLGQSSVTADLQDVWIVAFLHALYGAPKSALEVRPRGLDEFTIPSTIDDMANKIFDVIPAYENAVTSAYRRRSRICSAVQCGAYVLLPRVLTTESMGDVESSLLVMLPGSLSMDGVNVEGFYYEEQHGEDPVTDVREIERLPVDCSASHTIEYHYEEAERGYRFWTTEAGYRLNLDGLIEGLLSIRTILSYEDTSDHQSWLKAAPHHMVDCHANFKKTILLAYGNTAGRRLAISRVGDGLKQAVLYLGKDYRQALAYADQQQCEIVIL